MKHKVIIGIVIANLIIATGLLAQRPDRPLRQRPGRMAALDLTDEQQAKIQDLELK